MKFGARLAVMALKAYKVTLSPLFYLLGARCRHMPGCSQYAIEAYTKHGIWPGSWLTLARLSRCHHFGTHGIDNVPDEISGHPLMPWQYGDWRWRR